MGGYPLSSLPPRRNVLPKPLSGMLKHVAFSVASHFYQSSPIRNKFLPPLIRNAKCHVQHTKWRVADFFGLGEVV
jgi:hypothetical protein